MHYRLRNNLSSCDVDGHLIFLDVAQDRYFELTGDLAEAMRRFQTHEDVASTQVEDLTASRILVEAPNLKARSAIADIRRPTSSAIEQPTKAEGQGVGMAIVFEVMAIVWSTRHQLKTRTLKTTLDETIAYRDRKIGVGATPAVAEDKLLQATREFIRARRYVPIEPICLLDSLSLLRFLSRRKLLASIVFGVTPEPFTAHCWVQAGGMVLNETLFDSHTYTPNRVV
jgi:hypothetical protein